MDVPDHRRLGRQLKSSPPMMRAGPGCLLAARGASCAPKSSALSSTWSDATGTCTSIHRKWPNASCTSVLATGLITTTTCTHRWTLAPNKSSCAR